MSEQPMPKRDERKKNLKKFADQIIEQFSIIISKKELDIILNSVVNDTLDYSLSGYAVFGIKDERQRLLANLGLY